MKGVWLAMRNVVRHTRRSLLTFTAIALAVFIFTSLQTILDSLRLKPSGGDGTRRFAVLERYGGPRTELPLSYGESLRRIEGIDGVSALQFTLLSPQEGASGPFFVTFAIEPAGYMRAFPEVAAGVARAELDCFASRRDGALVGVRVLQSRGWRREQQIRMHSVMHGVEVDLTVCGALRDPTGTSPQTESQLLIRQDYYGLVRDDPDKVNMFWVALAPAADREASEQRIREAFRDERLQVIAQSEGAILEQMSRFTATIQFLLQSVSGLVLLTVSVVSGNTIAISTRERGREIAVMKAMGFEVGWLNRMILTEAAVMGLSGGLAGTLAGWLLFELPAVGEALGITYSFEPGTRELARNAGLSLLIGMVSGWIPAWRAARKRVVDTLQR